MLGRRSASIGLGALLAASAILAAACADEDQTSANGPYAVGDLLAALEARALTYVAVGPELACWNVTPAGPTRYEGNQASLAVWVYASIDAAEQVWGSNGAERTSVNAQGLRDMLGCFDSQMWVARRGNLIVALDRHDADAIATGAIVVEALGSLREPGGP